jgi:hypothetical protein
MAEYPLLFGYKDLVAGDGFLAGVSINGRALLVDEADEAGKMAAWVYGVNPGGLSAGGHDHGAATAAFRTAYRSVLFDIAAELHNFDEFRAEVERFFRETNVPREAEWEAAVAEVRAGRVSLDWLEKKSADSEFKVDVVKIAEPKPTANTLDEDGGAAIAA